MAARAPQPHNRSHRSARRSAGEDAALVPRVAWQGGTHSQFNRADVAHVARGVADRYRKEQPHDRTAAAIPRASPRTRVDFGSRSQASRGARFADLGRTGRGGPRAGGRGLTSREQLRDTLLTTPYASLEQPATPGNHAQRSRSDARTDPRDGDTRRFGGSTGAHIASDAQFDYLPPQYAKARQQARGGHMSIDAFLSSSRRQPLVPGGERVHVDDDSASFSGDDVSATGTDDASAASEGGLSDDPAEAARRIKQERAVAQLMFQQLQAQRADRELLSKEVSQLRKALRRRSTLAPALFSASDTAGGCDDKGVGTDPVPTAVKGVQAVLEMPDSPEVVALRDEVGMLRVKQAKQEAALRAADAHVEELELELAHARATTEESRRAAQTALKDAKTRNRSSFIVPSVETTSKCVGTDTKWASVMARANAETSKLVEALRTKDERVASANDKIHALESSVAELKALVAAQHERCAVLGAEAQSMERQLAAAQDELRTANTAMVSQAKALEMASQQQSYLQRKLDDALQTGRRARSPRHRAGSASSSGSHTSPTRSSPSGGTRLDRQSPRQRQDDKRTTSESSLQRPKMARRKSRVVAAAMTSFLGRYETVHAANVLQNSRTFGSLSADEAKQLVMHCTILLFKDGERLLTQGERGHFLFILLEGVAKIVVTSGGKDKELVRRQLGEVVGEFAIFSDEPRRASVIAVGRVKALLLTRDKYMELYRKTVGTTLHVVLEKLTNVPASGRRRTRGSVQQHVASLAPDDTAATPRAEAASPRDEVTASSTP